MTDPEDVCPQDELDLISVHCIWQETLDSLVKSCVRHNVAMTIDELTQAMEGVGEALYDHAALPLANLHANGFVDFSYTPEHTDNLIALAHDHMETCMQRVIVNTQTYPDIGESI